MNLFEILDENGKLDHDKLLIVLFEEYERRKADRSIHCKDSQVPKNLIKQYYMRINDPIFESLMTNFKKQYILNESKLELVHSQEEIDGLGEVYEYIHKFLSIENINVFIILRINSLLFSKTAHPEAGGIIRNMNVFLPNSGINLTDWSLIPTALQELYVPVNELVKKGINLGADKDYRFIIEYIDECIDLNCKLIKIHPFFDGNGRSIRAFTNLLFKLAKIPPVYVKPEEREEYESAMHDALGDENYNKIHQFYYCKICDSIAELDKSFQEEKIKTK